MVDGFGGLSLEVVVDEVVVGVVVVGVVDIVVVVVVVLVAVVAVVATVVVVIAIGVVVGEEGVSKIIEEADTRKDFKNKTKVQEKPDHGYESYR